MNKKTIFFLPLVFCLLLITSHTSVAQEQTAIDSLKQRVLEVELDVENIHVNLEKSRAKFQRGILVSTIGYTVTIIGGLMLGRENDDVGQVLLVAGGVTGITGTVMLVDAFKFLGRTRRR